MKKHRRPVFGFHSLQQLQPAHSMPSYIDTTDAIHGKRTPTKY